MMDFAPELVLRLVLVDLPGPELDQEVIDFFQRYPVGGVLCFSQNLPSAAYATELCGALHELVPDPILGIDQEGGAVVRLLDVPVGPSAMALGAADDPVITEAVAAATAQALRPLGFNFNLAPVADLSLNPDNSVIGTRSFGSDPVTVARHVRAWIRGQQTEGIASCAKHFPGHGDTPVDSHLDLPVLELDGDRLRSVELLPFQGAIAEECSAIMPGHLLMKALDGERPATVSPAVLQDLLRSELGFQGAVVTDALNMGAITRDYGLGAAAPALAAGADLLLVLGSWEEKEKALEGLVQAVRDGQVPEERIQEALRRGDELRRRFPSVPAEPLIRPDDNLLMDEAARRALSLVGELRPLETRESVLLVSCTAAGDSTDPTVPSAGELDPVGAGLHQMLLGRWRSTRWVRYPADEPLSSVGLLMEAARDCDRVLWLSSSPTRPTEDERALARKLAKDTPIVHLATESPYAAADLPQPALLSYGSRRSSLRALAAALADPGLCTGRLPVRLPEAEA